MRSIFKYFFTLFCFIVFLNGCKYDDDPVVQTEQLIRNEKLSFDQTLHFNKLQDHIGSIYERANSKPSSTTAKSGLDNTAGLKIFTDEVTYVTYAETHTYTFKMVRDNPEAYIENIVLHYNVDTEKYDEYLMQYFVTVEEFRAINNGELFQDSHKVRRTTLEQGFFDNYISTSRCSTTYGTVIVQCTGAQHHNPGESCPMEGSDRAYTYQVSVTTCYDDDPDPILDAGDSGGGGGGGGGTTNEEVVTNPDGSTICETSDYIGIVSADGGCVVNMDATVLSSQLNALLDYSLTRGQLLFLSENPHISILIIEELEADNYSIEAVYASKITVNVIASGKMGATPQDTVLQAAYDLHLPRIGISPTLFVQFYFYFSTECAILRRQNPNWSNSKIYWNASKEMVHTALDLGGLIPVAGEVCDITNGVIYTIEGDGINASLSYAAAIPIAGWIATGAKFAWKGSLKLVLKADGVVSFGARNSKKFRKALGLVTGDIRQAHHLLSRNLRGHRAIQKAAKSRQAFHIDEALNGIAVAAWRNQPNHSIYDANVTALLDAIPTNLSDSQTFDAIVDVMRQIRNVVANNPDLHLNALVF